MFILVKTDIAALRNQNTMSPATLDIVSSDDVLLVETENVSGCTG